MCERYNFCATHTHIGARDETAGNSSRPGISRGGKREAESLKAYSTHTRLEVSPERASACARLLVSVATAPCLSRNRWLSSFKETAAAADATRYIAPLISHIAAIAAITYLFHGLLVLEKASRAGAGTADTVLPSTLLRRALYKVPRHQKPRY